MNFEVDVKIITENGSVKKSGDELTVSNADAVTIYLSEATSFNGFDKSPGLQGKDPSIEAKSDLQKAIKKSYDQLKKDHISRLSISFQSRTLSVRDKRRFAIAANRSTFEKFCIRSRQ